MINKNCTNCGSRFTYAVPSRNKFKIGQDDKVVRDEQGEKIISKCRRCRSCGEDYFDDQTPTLTSKNEVQQRMINAALKHIADTKAKPQ